MRLGFNQMGRHIKDNLQVEIIGSAVKEPSCTKGDVLKDAFNNTSIGIFYLGLGGTIRCFNKKILQILDITLDEDDMPDFREMLVYANRILKNVKDMERVFLLPINDYYEPQQLVLETKDGKVLFCTSEAVLRDSLIEGIVWSVSDITEHKTQERIATYRSLHDSLTQLPNRTYLFQKLDKLTDLESYPHKTFALLFLDLDDFKQINDNYGHATGDEFLVNFSTCIRNSLRVPDTLVRLSGDEFVVILDNVDKKELVLNVIERIYQDLSNGFNIANEQMIASLSIGISFYPRSAQSPRKLIKLADRAMYSAKNNGKNTYCFYEDE